MGRIGTLFGRRSLLVLVRGVRGAHAAEGSGRGSTVARNGRSPMRRSPASRLRQRPGLSRGAAPRHDSSHGAPVAPIRGWPERCANSVASLVGVVVWVAGRPGAGTVPLRVGAPASGRATLFACPPGHPAARWRSAVWGRGWVLGLGFIVVACAARGSGGAAVPEPPATPGVNLVVQARTELARWAAADHGPLGVRRFSPVGELSGQVGTWSSAEAAYGKIALLSGQLSTLRPLSTASPAGGRIVWADGVTRGSPVLSAAAAFRLLAGHRDCGGCRALVVNGAHPARLAVQTSHGPAVVPAWSYTLQGSQVRVLRSAVPPEQSVTVTPPAWDSTHPPAGISVDSAVLAADERRLTVQFIGAGGPGSAVCGADYTARAVESSTAAVILITEHPHQASQAHQGCGAVGHLRTAALTLTRPIGQRAILEIRQGLPVPVTTGR